ncbi:MAG: phosphopantetheine-binding protein [Planctomycetaceae bacterium]
MSSLINASTSSDGTPTNGSGSHTVVHFDATLRRKEKMKRLSANEQPAVAAPVAVARSVAASAAPMPPKSAPAGANGGGNGTHAVQRANPAPAVSPVRPVPQARAATPAPVARPQAAAPTAPASAPATASAGLSGPTLEKFLINFVVEQTGYPEEMVELDADLEADLGIDSIKKAQLFGELGEYFEVQVTEDLSLDDFPTLRHVVKFLDGVPQKGTSSPAAPQAATAPQPPHPVQPAVKAPIAAAPKPAVAAPAPVAAPSAASGAPGLSGPALEKFLINFVVEQTGYPEEMVELDADLEADLGIDSIKKAQLFGELAEYFEVQVTEELSLDDFPTLRHVLQFLDGVPQKSSLASAAGQPAAAAVTPAPVRPVVAAPPVVRAAVAPAAPAPVASAPPRPQAPTPQPAIAADGDLESFLVNFVVEQTGYPEEMVELDADLEADLGIDSIKKAQLFGELGEYFEVQVTEDLSLDDFPTLRHVMNFLAGVPRKAAR